MPTSLFRQMFSLLISDPLVLFILSAVLGVLGLILSLIYWDLLKKAGARKNWPSVPGKITTSHVSKTEANVGTGGRSLYEVKYIPHVKFSYTVGGTAHEGELDTGINAWLFRGSAESVVKHYPVGATLPVYYDPADPKNAVLIKAPAAN